MALKTETTDTNGEADDMPDGAGDLAARPDGPTGPLMVQTKGTTMARAFAGLMPQTIGEAFLLATYLSKSNAIPKGLIGKPESVLTIILAGLEMGLTPIRALQSITNISGTLCMKADLQLALVQRSGVVAFYEESFEEKGKTDTTLARRVQLALKGKADQDAVTLAVEKIQAAAADLKPGNPYAWAMGIRQGSDQVHVRTFTFADATKAVIYEASEDGSGPKEKKPLAEKFNYKSFPGDMYPKRARTRLLQVLASEVTAGLPAAEAIEGGQIIEGDFRVTPQGDNETVLLQEITDADEAQAKAIAAAFDELQLAPAKRLQLLTQFRGKHGDLYDWCRDEYARRRGAAAAPPKGSGTGKKKAPARGANHPTGNQPDTPGDQVDTTKAAEPVDPVQAAKDFTAAVTGKPQAPDTAPATATRLDVVGTTGGKATTETVVPAGPGARMRDAAAQLKKNRQTL